MAKAKLTAKHKLFCQNYIIDLNATQAYLKVYPKSTIEAARRNAHRLMIRADVESYIQKAMDKRSKKIEITSDLILSELLRLAKVDVTQAFDEKGNLKPLHEIDEDVRRAISGIEVSELYDGSGEDKTFAGHLKKLRF